MKLGIEGKVAVITGGSKGIGLAIRKSLEQEGVRVKSLSRTEGYDLMKTSDLFRACLNMQHADILINNVGGMGTVREQASVMYKNYSIMVRLTEEYLKKPRDYGRVITISSIFGKEKGHNPYFTAAKAAQIAFMKSLAGEYTGITFNTICPGYIDVGKPFPNTIEPERTRLIKQDKIGRPEDVSSIVAFLCSQQARHINGACITVDGGESHSF